jgi:hypothetical protein
MSQAKGGKKGSQHSMALRNKEYLAASQIARLERKESIERINEMHRRAKEFMDNVSKGRIILWKETSRDRFLK